MVIQQNRKFLLSSILFNIIILNLTITYYSPINQTLFQQAISDSIAQETGYNGSLVVRNSNSWYGYAWPNQKIMISSQTPPANYVYVLNHELLHAYCYKTQKRGCGENYVQKQCEAKKIRCML